MLLAVGAVAGVRLVAGPWAVGRMVLDIHTLLVASFLVVLGYQAVAFALFTKLFAVRERFLPPDRRGAGLAAAVGLEEGTGGRQAC